MDDVTRTRRLIAAEVELAWLDRRLATTQVAALLGLHYDDRDYDRVILEHRRARRAAGVARRAFGGLPAQAPVAA